MTTFALITEGITDQVVIENILYGLTKGAAVTREILPKRDATDISRVEKGKFSGWELVFEFLQSEDIIDAIDNNDFVIIQIDTDEGDHPNFGLGLNGKTIITIVEECIEKLKASLRPDFPTSELERLLFAIPVLSTECWIFSLHDATHKHTEKTMNNCEERLRFNLKQKIKKEYNFYRAISYDFRKQKNIQAVAQRTPCLQHFVNQVNAACPSF